MSDYLTEEGLVIKRQPEVIADLVESLQINVDPDIYTRDDEFIGQQNNVVSTQIASLWELIQAIKDQDDINKAEGIHLDNKAALRYIYRYDAAAAISQQQQFIGADGTIVPSGTRIDSTAGIEYYTTEVINVSSTTCRVAEYSVSTVLDTQLYSIIINTNEFLYTSDADATEGEILAGLKVEMDADTSGLFTSSIVDDVLTIDAATDVNLSISSTTYLSADRVTIVTNAVSSVLSGDIVSASNTVTDVVSFINGLESTTNLVGTTGARVKETDADFRERIKATRNSASTGTLPAIRQGLLDNVENVTRVDIVENTEGTTVSGRPEHTYECVISGGDQDAILEELLRSKPAGIATYGSTSEVLVDSSGRSRVIMFSRPTPVNLAIRVTYSNYLEETPSGTRQTKINTALADYINSLSIGEDFIPERTFGAIYAATQGIDSLTVEVQQITDVGDEPLVGSWQSTRLSIGDTQFASFETSDVTHVEL